MLQHTTFRRAVVLAAAGALLLSACGDDAEPEAAESSEPEAVESSEPEETETEAMMEPDTYEVSGTDYMYSGIPAEMAVGSTLVFTNESTVEVHELVAVNVGDDERPLFDILTEFQAALEAGETSAIIPAMVHIQGPGGEPAIPAVNPSGTLTEPGRYIFLCAIQQGVDPQAYFEEAARMQEAGEEGPVVFEDGGQPHAALGMVAEARVS